MLMDCQNESPINITLQKIKLGDKNLREQLIKDYLPFILKTIAGVTRKFIDIQNNDEFSIGLLAFNEAIDRYEKKRSDNFIKFSQQVIICRVLDYLRRMQKNAKEYPFTYFENNNGEKVFVTQLLCQSEYSLEDIETKEDINLLKTELLRFGIILNEVRYISPKHKDSIQKCLHIAKIISDNDTLFFEMIKKKHLPLKQMMEFVDVHRKTIERNRKFIIASVLILRSGLDILQWVVK